MRLRTEHPRERLRTDSLAKRLSQGFRCWSERKSGFNWLYHEPKVRLLQYKVLQAIRALPDTPAKSITSIRKAFSKSIKLGYKAMTIKETLALSFSTTEIEAMSEYETFDHFLEKCQGGLNLSEMLEEQLSVCKRDLIQTKGESAADFAARAESTMPLFEELLQGSGFTNGPDGVDKLSLRD